MPYLFQELGMTASARFDLKLDAMDKDLLSRAASLMGTTMAGFVRSAAKEKAQSLVDQEARIVLSKRDMLNFHQAVQAAFQPNPALQKALRGAAKVKRAQ
jgi:uncharacterized protein (DUF1778 family)